MREHAYHNHGRGGDQRGFTILEVLVALTIFTLVTVTVYAIFRAGIRSQNTGERETDTIRRARYAMDTIERDLNLVFVRDETGYNVAISRLIEKMEQDRMTAEESGNWNDFYLMYGDPNDPESMRTATLGNPFEKGRIIDLQFQGKDGGKTDSITFAAVHPFEPGKPYRPFGVARIKYYVEKGVLLRFENTVENEQRNQYGEFAVAPQPPLVTPLTEGIEEFEITYAFWYDNQWYEVDEWNSANRRVRNPRYILGDYEDEWEQRNPDATGQQAIVPGSDAWNQYINDQWNEPLDRLPAEIRVKVTIVDPKTKTRPHTYQRIIRLYAAEETYYAGPELTEDERENERFLRDQKYRLIFPGVLDDF